jgi:hypothetical protein
MACGSDHPLLRVEEVTMTALHPSPDFDMGVEDQIFRSGVRFPSANFEEVYE